MTTLSLSLFESARASSKAAAHYDLPLNCNSESGSLLATLNIAVDLVRRNELNPWISLSSWDAEGHSNFGHRATTAVVLEYDADHASEALDRLKELGWTFLAGVTLNKKREAFTFIIPIDEPVGYDNAIRLSNIVAYLIGIKGAISKGCSLPTFFFKLSDSEFGQREGTLMSRDLLDQYSSTFIRFAEYERK